MGNVEIPKWLKDLPLAPEFHPTDTEFADPIAYISKIEKKASAFGICKIIPPLPKPSKRYVFGNLNKSLSKCPELGDGVNFSNVTSLSKTGSGETADDGESKAVFTSRHQELGRDFKKTKGMVKENPQLGVHKQVWQSGEIYTLDQFELKSKAFAKSLLGLIKDVNPLVVEALFWKAASEKPIYVEYANDVPGSGFGEPEGQFRYFHKRRRRRASYKSFRRSTGSSECKDSQMYSVHILCNDEMRAAAIKNDASTSSQTVSRSPPASSTSFSEENVIPSKRKSVNTSNDVEGTAGWKLSNSPWNLQVIARSPGSLTRFMPDDIPGVTSPMVYIGMLFSWFAWHVEDHELHSMNFLHTGSPKTWYAVPGDYALAFEEVIRAEAYGGGCDRLAALTLLGEKTTLLSPELIVSSGIPCCRLVQNPGEFVVTFPRAYHVGFSHGFNCGEAANFGTPQWLKFAKEAAIRRAAMNYLPMLSHQQLLYLLTMSFVSRVPRSLLPGARSSRLRDRLKEERELSVKKAFIEDMLKENNILSALLVKDSTYSMVIWNPDLLPCANKDSQLPSIGAVMTEEIDYHACSKDSSGTTANDLFKEMSLYMETLNDLYVEDDDISCDFQVDSGALACVACGILGFPFMSVVQPSQRASEKLLPQHHPLVQEESRVEKFETCCSPAALDGSSRGPVPDRPMPRGWNNSSKFLRPRIFCLEHGVQIEELLQSKGGANMLVICHSDYQKIKAHAAAIAEEITTPFNFAEVPLESATQEDLNVISLAIDDEDNDELGGDWTSKLGINLHYCVKVRKNSPSNKVQHALALGGLFSDETSSDFLNIKWKSRRSRSKVNLNRRILGEQSKRVEPNKNDILGMTSDGVNVKKEAKFIQYTRRKYRVKIECSTSWDQGLPWKQTVEEVSVANCEDLVKHSGKGSKSSPCSVGISERELPEVLHEVQVLEATEEMNLMSTSLHVTCSHLTTSAATERVVGQVEHQPLERSHENDNLPAVSACGSFNIQHDKVDGGMGANEDLNAKEFSSQHVTVAQRIPKMQVEYQTVDEVTGLANPPTLHVYNQPLGQIENTVAKKSCLDSVVVADMSCMSNEVCDLANTTLDNKVKSICQTPGKRNGNQCISVSDQFDILQEEKTACPQETCAAEDELQQKVEITSVACKQLVPSNIRMIHDLKPVCPDESSQNSRQPSVASDLCNLTLEKGMQQGGQTTYESNKEHVSCSISQMEIDQPSAVSGEGFTTVLGRISAKDGLSPGTTSVSKTLSSTSESKVVGFVPNSTTRAQDPSVPVTLDKCSKSCCSDALSVGLNLETEMQKEMHSDNVVYSDVEVHEIHQTTSEEEPLCSHVTQIGEQTPVLTRRCFQTEEESCSTGNVQKGLEDCSSHELESTESAMVDPSSTARKGKKRRNELEQLSEDKLGSNCFIKSPCEGLRPRVGKDATYRSEVDIRKSFEENPVAKMARRSRDTSVPIVRKKEITKKSHKCDLDSCTMSFETKAELQLHKRNRCPYEGCRKRFNSHKYAIIHQRVHEDDRPLKCPWNGCSMSFKWAWARTEHIRVHTGEKPYKCKVEGCGRSFRFVSDYSRHRRKTGHYVNTPA